MKCKSCKRSSEYELSYNAHTKLHKIKGGYIETALECWGGAETARCAHCGYELTRAEYHELMIEVKCR